MKKRTAFLLTAMLLVTSLPALSSTSNSSDANVAVNRIPEPWSVSPQLAVNRIPEPWSVSPQLAVNRIPEPWSVSPQLAVNRIPEPWSVKA